MLRKPDGTPVQPLKYVFGSDSVLVQHGDGTLETVALASLTHDEGARAKNDLLRLVRVDA